MTPVRLHAAGCRVMSRAMPKSMTFTSPFVGDDDVAGLQVAVNDVVAMSEFQRGGDGLDDALRLRRPACP